MVARTYDFYWRVFDVSDQTKKQMNKNHMRKQPMTSFFCFVGIFLDIFPPCKSFSVLFIDESMNLSNKHQFLFITVGR